MRHTKDTRLNNLSDFYCTCCGHKGIPIIRRTGKAKEPGHLKKLFCLYCNDEKNMVEIKNKGPYTLEEFWIEYKYGNFDSEGQRKMPYKQFINEVKHGRIEVDDNVNDNREEFERSWSSNGF